MFTPLACRYKQCGERIEGGFLLDGEKIESRSISY